MPVSKDDLKLSQLRGFVEVQLASNPSRQVRYLPVAQINQIDYFDYGVFIEWKTERMKNGRGYMTTVIYVPREVRNPDEVIELLREAMNGQVPGSKK